MHHQVQHHSAPSAVVMLCTSDSPMKHMAQGVDWCSPAPGCDSVLAAYSCSTFCSSATIPSSLSSLALRIHAKAFDRSACMRLLFYVSMLERCTSAAERFGPSHHWPSAHMQRPFDLSTSAWLRLLSAVLGADISLQPYNNWPYVCIWISSAWLPHGAACCPAIQAHMHADTLINSVS